MNADDVQSDLTPFVVAIATARGVGTVAARRILDDVVSGPLHASDLFELPDDVLMARYGVTAEAARNLRSSPHTSLSTAAQLAEMGVRAIATESVLYPPQLLHALGKSAPPYLFVSGDLDILRLPGVGFCGSRKASPRAIDVVTECSTELGRESVNVISGYASGVDIASHRAALDAGGVTTIVLAEGIGWFKPKPQVRDLVTAGNALVISQFPPRLPWNVGNAMTRNATICALADAMVVIESSLTGGTFAAGLTALALKRPLFVVDYAESHAATGNRALLDKGARPLRRRRTDGQANTADVLKAALTQAKLDERNEWRRRHLSSESEQAVAEASRPTLWSYKASA